MRSTAMALSALDAEAVLVAKNSQVYWRDSASMSFNAISGLPDVEVGDLAIDAQDIDVWWISFGVYDEGQQVWRTDDQGTTWENVSAGLPALPIQVLTS